MGEIRRTDYQGFYKDNEGEAHIVDMVSSTTIPDVDESLFINRARSVNVRPSRRKKPQRKDEELTIALGDAQMPFHDERALALGLTAIRELQPDNVALTGDMVDLPRLGTYEQREEWLNTTQQGLDRFHRFLGQIRAEHDGPLYVVHGNHEERMPKMLRRDAAALMGIKRANADNELSVLTLSYLLRYDELDVTAITGYPNGTLWLEDNIQVIHGTEARKGGRSAGAYLGREVVSTIFGHDHRLQVAWQHRNARAGHIATVAASPGCLAALDGSVPGRFTSTDDRGQNVPHAPDWQHGVLAIMHNPRNHDVVPLRMSERGINIGTKYYSE